MNLSPNHILIATALLLAAFACLTMCRILAIYRYSQIVPYDMAREARRLRAEYDVRMQESESSGYGSGDKEVITV